MSRRSLTACDVGCTTTPGAGVRLRVGMSGLGSDGDGPALLRRRSARRPISAAADQRGSRSARRPAAAAASRRGGRRLAPLGRRRAGLFRSATLGRPPPGQGSSAQARAVPPGQWHDGHAPAVVAGAHCSSGQRHDRAARAKHQHDRAARAKHQHERAARAKRQHDRAASREQRRRRPRSATSGGSPPLREVNRPRSPEDDRRTKRRAGAGRMKRTARASPRVGQTRRRTATTRPMMVASSPGIGSKAGLAGINQTCPSRCR